MLRRWLVTGLRIVSQPGRPDGQRLQTRDGDGNKQRSCCSKSVKAVVEVFSGTY